MTYLIKGLASSELLSSEKYEVFRSVAIVSLNVSYENYIVTQFTRF
jgi:hypothetical protein